MHPTHRTLTLTLQSKESMSLTYISNDAVHSSVTNDTNTTTELKQVLESSDLSTGTYEGGLKLWEGAIDLCQYIAGNSNDLLSVSNADVIEIGCGAGLPGILSLKLGVRKVMFQDYNPETLTHSTKPNLVLNGYTSIDQPSKCLFFHGDWTELKKKLLQKIYCKNSDRISGFDLVLTAETIYNRDSYEKLYDLLKHCVKANGQILIAAKWVYFGLSGSAPEWIEFVNSKNEFDIDIVWRSDTSVPRVIMKMVKIE